MGANMKYYCDKCKNTFYEIKTGERKSYDWYSPPEYEEYCPYCGADADEHVWETDECAWCGEDMPPEALTGSVFCEDCKEELAAWWEKVLDGFAGHNMISGEAAEKIISEYLSGTLDW